jgi:hypothetical protein
MPKPIVAYFCAAQWPVFTPPLTATAERNFYNAELTAKIAAE